MSILRTDPFTIHCSWVNTLQAIVDKEKSSIYKPIMGLDMPQLAPESVLDISYQPTHAMTESEYKQLAEFQDLPLYDDDHPLCSAVDHPEIEGRDGTIWIAVHEATDLKTAREHLQKEKRIPKGGIRFWDGDHKKSRRQSHLWTLSS